MGQKLGKWTMTPAECADQVTFDVAFDNNVKDWFEIPAGLTKAGDNAYYITKQTLAEAASAEHTISLKDYAGDKHADKK